MAKPDLSTFRSRMDKSVAALKEEFGSLRTGRGQRARAHRRLGDGTEIFQGRPLSSCYRFHTPPAAGKEQPKVQSHNGFFQNTRRLVRE